jgi:hypothetical protein
MTKKVRNQYLTWSIVVLSIVAAVSIYAKNTRKNTVILK